MTFLEDANDFSAGINSTTDQNGSIEQNRLKPKFKTDDFALYHGDCLEVMDKLPDNYVDMIFADPPYMLSNNGFTCQAGRMVSVKKRSGVKF